MSIEARRRFWFELVNSHKTTWWQRRRWRRRAMDDRWRSRSFPELSEGEWFHAREAAFLGSESSNPPHPQPASAVSPMWFPAVRELPTFPRVMLACPSRSFRPC